MFCLLYDVLQTHTNTIWLVELAEYNSYVLIHKENYIHYGSIILSGDIRDLTETNRAKPGLGWEVWQVGFPLFLSQQMRRTDWKMLCSFDSKLSLPKCGESVLGPDPSESPGGHVAVAFFRRGQWTLSVYGSTEKGMYRHRCPFPIDWLINRGVCLPL